ncbi:MAG: hypothetical protein HOW71_38365, partial [Nonomuraea sp.]|nr:hypothetical protein [Nonomuraea sp.]
MSTTLDAPAQRITPLHAQLIDTIGRQVVSGELPPGTVLRIDQLDERHG